MNSKERILAALNHLQPDRVPIFELQIDEPIVYKLADLLGITEGPMREVSTFVHGDESAEVVELYCRVHEALGLDATCNIAAGGMQTIGSDLGRDKYDCVFQLSPHGEPVVLEGPIKELADLRTYDMAARLEAVDFAGILGMIDRLGTGVAHFLDIYDPFKVSWMLRGGMDNLMIDYMLAPDLAHGVARLATQFLLKEVEMAAGLGVDGIIMEGDLAGEKNLLISPKHFREFVKPYEKEVVDRIHQLGLKVIKHSDGNMWPILDDLVEVGFDGFNPVQPQCMDIGEVKAHLFGKMAIIGNIDCRNLLVFGSEDEVEKTVAETIAVAAPGGGYIISSSNSIHAGCKPENYLAMIRAAHRYGEYARSA